MVPPGPAVRQDGAQTARLAIDALRRGNTGTAWLLADRLCRTAPPHQRSDALLLRAAVLRRRGEAGAADEDLALAAHLDPLSPSVNRALLGHSAPHFRVRAGRRLVASEDRTCQEQGMAALAREGFGCVGRLSLAGGILEARIAWRGSGPLALRVLTDTSATSLSLAPANAPAPHGFDSVAQIVLEVPAGVTALALEAPGRRASFEPATIAVPAPAFVPQQPGGPGSSRGLLIVVPVYDDLHATTACLASLLAARPAGITSRIVVIDDVTPDPAIAAELDRLEASGTIELRRNSLNLGFAASVNRGLAERPPGWDALLVNADTVIPSGAIDRLLAHLAARHVGTVTPLSNNGEDTSLPLRFRVNPLPSADEVERIDAAAATANHGRAIDLPNGVGFCLLISGSLLDEVGPLSHDFGRGYYEDVEFCLRAAAAGYRNVCATDAFVGHHGGRSFAGEKRALVAANLRTLQARHPTFRERSSRFETEDPLRPEVARLEQALLETGRSFDLLLLPQDCPPGLAELAAAALADGSPPVLLHARTEGGETRFRLAGAAGASPQSFDWISGDPGETAAALRAALAPLPVRSVLVPAGLPLPAPFEEAVGDGRWPLRLVSLSGGALGAALTAFGRAELRVPGRAGAGVLAAVLVQPTPEDMRWAAVLAQALAPRLQTIIVEAGPPDAPATADHHGPVPDAELPDWLSRLGVTAVLFVSTRWAAIDPRPACWAAGGMPTALRDAHRSSAEHDGPCLVLPGRADAPLAAGAVLAWLRPPSAAPGVDQDALEGLVGAG